MKNHFAIQLCASKVTGERMHPLEAHKYQFFCPTEYFPAVSSGRVLQPPELHKFPQARIHLDPPALQYSENLAAAFDMRAFTSRRRGKNSRAEGLRLNKKRVRTHLPALGAERAAPPAMAAAVCHCVCVFICLQFFYDTLDSLELNTTRLIFTLMAVKTREPPPPTNHGIQRIKNMTSAAL